MVAGIQILLVEDNRDEAFLVQRALERHTAPMAVAVVRSARECVAALAASTYAAVLLDYHLPGTNGLELLRELHGRGHSLPVVMVTGEGDERVAVEAMKAGAADYVIKTPEYFVSLPTVILKAIRQHALASENARLDREARRRLRETEGLLALAENLGASLDRDQIAARTTRDFAALLEADTALFLRLAADGRTFGLAGSYNSVDALADVEISVTSEELAALRERHDTVPRALETLAIPQHSLCCVPVLTGARCFGILVALWWGRSRSVAGDDRLPDAVAKHMALALENARLYRETQDALAELARTQEQLVRGHTLRAVGEMAAGTAHHLNNLLTIALGRLQLLRRRLAESTATLLAPVDIIDQALQDAASVVRRMQYFARTEPAGQQAPIDLNQIATEVRDFTATQWADAQQSLGIPVTVEIEAGPVRPVFGDAAALRELVTDLMLNAIDAMPAGGVITLHTYEEAQSVCLAVTDSGIGMTPEVKERALEPFFTTKGPKGTGLGLSLAYGIIRRHGGDLEIASSPGHGTTVTVRLPASDASRVGSLRLDTQRAGASTARNLCIVVVDDEERVRSTIVDMLEADGHRVLHASGGAGALALLEHEPHVDVVLTDHGMPGMTGLELTRAIKTRWPDRVVGLVTGWGDDPDRLSIGTPADFTLAKPVRVSTLREALTRHAGGGGRATVAPPARTRRIAGL